MAGCAAGLESGHNQHYQLHLRVPVKVLQEVGRGHIVEVVKTKDDNLAPDSLVARERECALACKQQQQLEDSKKDIFAHLRCCCVKHGQNCVQQAAHNLWLPH